MEGFLVSIPDAADALGVSVHMIRKAIASGDLQGKTLADRLFIVRESLYDYIER